MATAFFWEAAARTKVGNQRDFRNVPRNQSHNTHIREECREPSEVA